MSAFAHRASSASTPHRFRCRRYFWACGNGAFHSPRQFQAQLKRTTHGLKLKTSGSGGLQTYLSTWYPLTAVSSEGARSALQLIHAEKDSSRAAGEAQPTKHRAYSVAEKLQFVCERLRPAFLASAAPARHMKTLTQ